jgi:hypothetical protein
MPGSLNFMVITGQHLPTLNQYLMTKITEKISNENLDQLISEIFQFQTLEQTGEDLDKLYFEFVNNENPDTNEKNAATVSYFHLKKLLQCLIERKPASSVNYFLVSSKMFV